MAKIKFTDTKLNSTVHEGKDIDYYDTKSSALLLRVGKRTKTFYIYYNRSMHKLGRFCPHGTNGLNVEKARMEALNFRSVGANYLDGFSKVTLRYYLDNQYLKDAMSLYNKAITERHINSIKRDFQHCLDKPCSKITDEDFDIYSKKSEKLKENTKRRSYYSLSAVLNTLVAKKRLKVNVLEKRSLSASSTRPINTFSINRHEIITYLLSDDFGKNNKLSKGFRIEPRLISAFVIDGGFRPGEIFKNKLDNFVLYNEPKVIIPSELSKNKTPREVPIFSEVLLDKVRHYVKHQHKSNLSRLMFYNLSTNNYFGEGSYRKVWEHLKEKYNLHGRFYDFRHTFATDVYEQSGDIKLAADLIGDTVETASKYYTKSSSSYARARLKGITGKHQ